LENQIMKHVVTPISTHAASRANWALLQQFVAHAVAAGDIDRASAIAAASDAIDTMPDLPAAASQDAVMMLKAFRALVEQEIELSD
jgi:hypothetical protein